MENPQSLPNYRIHKEDSDNGGDAVELAQFYMQLDKEGTHCPHGIDYDTGRIDGKTPLEDRARTLEGSSFEVYAICPCCTKVQTGGSFAHGQIDHKPYSTYCPTCKPI